MSSAATLSGCARVVASYEAFGRPAHMTFAVRVPDVIDVSSADCEELAHAYGLWENDGVGLGYNEYRGEDSAFTNCQVSALSGSPPATFVDQSFRRSGGVFSFIAPLLPTSCAPIVRLGTVERGAASGRIYLAGLTSLVADLAGDTEKVNGTAILFLQSAIATLQAYLATVRGCVMVAPHYSYQSTPRSLRAVHVVTDVGVYELMGTQRRRTRPG